MSPYGRRPLLRFKKFWKRLTGADKLEHVEEELGQDLFKEPTPAEDHEEIKEDVPLRTKIFRV